MHNDVVRSSHGSEPYISVEREAALNEKEHRRALYSGLYARVSPVDTLAIVTDDDVATGINMLAAIDGR